jgi:hypothetical protein
MEIWKTIENAPNYEVSNLGQIRNIKTKEVLIGSQTGKRDKNSPWRYKSHGLQVNGKRVFTLTHRLVAKAFVPNPNNLPQVNHIDENKLNNIASNLQWTNNKENSRHSNNVKIKQLDMNGNLIKIWNSLYEIGDYGFNKPAVSMCLNKKSNGKYLVTKHKNFIWEYL